MKDLNLMVLKILNFAIDLKIKDINSTKHPLLLSIKTIDLLGNISLNFII